ncbi:MAG: hypothetical protein QOJ80_992 [Mycobacterium sp.]|nr:hypothetical protein [Mycobacterium sp.]
MEGSSVWIGPPGAPASNLNRPNGKREEPRTDVRDQHTSYELDGWSGRMTVDNNHVRRRHGPVAAKVPEITASFWVLKLLTTAMGEAASDYLLNTMRLVGLGVGAAGFATALWVQFRTRRYNAFAYWAAVMMVAVFGTMAADTLHHQLDISFGMSSLACALAVAATFWAWYRVEHTLSIHSITTRRREVFYWLTVSFTFALGTAAGDLTASQLHFGFVGSIVLFAVVMAVPALGCWRLRLSTVVAFWWAYIVTRPLGASVADWLSKPTKSGGLSYGDGPVAAILLAFALVLITFAAIRRPKSAPTFEP